MTVPFDAPQSWREDQDAWFAVTTSTDKGTAWLYVGPDEATAAQVAAWAEQQGHPTRTSRTRPPEET